MSAATTVRAALPSIPVVNQLPGIRKTGGDPSRLHEVRTATITREHVSAYAAVCGFPVKDVAPLTYPHVLAFPLHLAVMSSPLFPFPAIGVVHVANTLTRHRQLGIGERVQLEVHTSTPRPHPKGTAIDFRARAHVGAELVWESSSTYLRRGPADSVVSTGSTSGGGELPAVAGRISWRLPGDVGRRYAAVSGDLNPIHLHPLAARAFGFPRRIAHGMWSLARCVAALENRLPDAVTLDAVFRKPILLPGTVEFGQQAIHGTDPGLAFALTDPKTGAPHVVGRTRASA
jgi:hypothetical protein